MGSGVDGDDGSGVWRRVGQGRRRGRQRRRRRATPTDGPACWKSSINRNVDILFLVDDSSSMRLAQDNLRRNFPAFMTRLQEPPNGPSQHPHRGRLVGHGRGRRLGRQLRLDRRQERDLPVHARAATARRRTSQAGATYISDIGGVSELHRQRSRTCSPASPRSAKSGCGFEHQFAAILRALGADGGRAPAENQGFLRPDAYLAIVMMTNEDDCSGDARACSCSTRARTPTSRRSSGRPAISVATSSATCANGRTAHPSRNAPNNDVTAMVTYHELHVERSGGLPARASPTPRIGSRRSKPIRRRSSSLDPGAGGAVHGDVEGARARRTPRAARRRARGRRSRTRAPPPTAASPIRAFAPASSSGSSAATGSCCRSARTTSRPSLRSRGDGDQLVLSPRCLPGLVGEIQRTGLPDCKVTAQ